MDQTTARLRKTFHYPTDNDEQDDLPEALDEEEQETLIQTLALKNVNQNATYRLILLSLPLLSLIPYLPFLFTPQTAFVAGGCITSLGCTGYLLFNLGEGGEVWGDLGGGLSLSKGNENQTKGLKKKEFGNERGRKDEGPIQTYLPLLNLLLCIVLAILGIQLSKRGRVEVWMGAWFGCLPGFAYGVVVGAKWVMGSVDPERELGGLRYGFKGA